MVKLIAVDIDGTLLGPGRKVAKQTKLAMKKAREQGIKICIATGRNPITINKIANDIGLIDNEGYVVGFNGGKTIQFKNGEPDVIKETPLTVKDIKTILQAIEGTKIVLFGYKVGDDAAFGTSKKGIFMWWMQKHSKRKIKIITKDNIPSEAYKFIAYGKGSEMKKFREEMVAKKFETYGWSYVDKAKSNIEVNPPGIDKVAGLKALCDKFNIKQSEVLYFGDGENDMKALEWAGYGVAMDNASDHVKAVANYTTDHHKKHGVANFINKILSGEIK